MTVYPNWCFNLNLSDPAFLEESRPRFFTFLFLMWDNMNMMFYAYWLDECSYESDLGSQLASIYISLSHLKIWNQCSRLISSNQAKGNVLFHWDRWIGEQRHLVPLCGKTPSQPLRTRLRKIIFYLQMGSFWTTRNLSNYVLVEGFVFWQIKIFQLSSRCVIYSWTARAKASNCRPVCQFLLQKSSL